MKHYIPKNSIKNLFYLFKFKICLVIFFILICKNSHSFETHEIAEGYYVHFGKQEDSNKENKGDIANLGFIIGNKSIAVIDTGGTPEIGEKLLQNIRTISNLPISHVIITHSHPDHFFGTEAFFNKNVKIVGHEKIERSLINNFEFYKNLQFNLIKQKNLRKAKLILPNEKIPTNTTKTFDLGKRKIKVKAWKSGHTDNDLSIYDEKTKFFWSEIIFINRIPSIRASIKGWKSNLEEISKMNIKKIIPGHGPVTSKEEALQPMINYFDRLINSVREFHKSNKTLKEAQKNISKKNIEGWVLFEPYHSANITKTFTELEWE